MDCKNQITAIHPALGDVPAVLDDTWPERDASGRALRLFDPKPVARRVANGRISDTPGLRSGLLQHLDSRCAGDLLEGGVEVLTAKVHWVQLTLGEQGSQCVSVLLGPPPMRLGQHDPDFRLGFRYEGDPSESLVGDIEGHGQSKGVPIEGEGGLRVINSDVDGAQGNCHAAKVKW